MNDIHIINNYNNHGVHFLLNMKKSLERQNSYIFSLIEETNEYNSEYKSILKVKQENTFLLTLQKQKIMNETIEALFSNHLSDEAFFSCNPDIAITQSNSVNIGKIIFMFIPGVSIIFT